MARSDAHARHLLIALLIGAVLLAAVLVRPFWVALFLAAVLAATLRRPMEWLTRLLRGRRNLAAVLVTMAVLLAVVVPIAAMGAVLVGEVVQGIQWLRGALESEGVWGLVQRLPEPVARLVRYVVESLGDPQRQLQQWAGSQGGQAAAAVGGVLSATGTFLFQSAMMLIGLFFFLVDGRPLVDWLDARVPLRPGQFRALLADFRRTSVSVLVATAATAGLQTVVAFVGYLLARTPNPVFLALLTLIAALVPAAGATVMVIVIAALLLATGHTVAGIFLLAWGVAVVGLVDNIIRPILLKGGMALHGGLVFFSLLGGVAVFGGIGLVVGPVALTFLLSALNMYWREFGEPERASDPLSGAGAPASSSSRGSAAAPAAADPAPGSAGRSPTR
jgi:predicted PurR-regulated permease PerM